MEFEKELLEKYGALKNYQHHLVEIPREIRNSFINCISIKTPITPHSSKKDDVVLCHGFGSGLGFYYRNFSPISKGLCDRRVFGLDWLGMGHSGRPSDFPLYKNGSNGNDGHKKAIAFFIDSFEVWREMMGIERMVLVGHSMGGYLATHYALQYPNRVSKLILASPVGIPVPKTQNDGIAVTGHKIPAWLNMLWNRNWTPQALIRGPFGRKLSNLYIDSRFSFLPTMERECLAKYFYSISVGKPSGEYALAALLSPGAWAREPLHHLMGALKMPCVFAYGEWDWMDKKGAEEVSKEMVIANTKIIEIKGSGHQMYIDNDEAFSQLIIDEVNNICESSSH